MDLRDRIIKEHETKSLAPYILLILPVLTSISLIFIYSVNIPFFDEWEIVKLYQEIESSGIHFRDFFAQHNEHRILFPRIVMLTTNLLTNWNVVALMLISQLLLIMVAICYIKYLWNIEKKTRTLWAAVPMMVLLFSLRQYENMFWGFQVGFLMAFSFGIFSFFFYDKYDHSKSKKYIFYSGIFAFIAAYSSIQGLLIWICYFILLILQMIFEKEKIDKTKIIFLFFGVLCWSLYFIGYNKPSGHPELGQGGLLNMINYLLVMLGGSIFPEVTLARVFGVLLSVMLAATAVLLIIRKQIKNNVFPILIILFALGVIGSITIGRSGFGINQALASRYTTFTLLIPTGVYMILYRAILKRHITKAKFYRGIIFGTLLLMALSVINIIGIQHDSSNKKAAEYALLNFDQLPHVIRQRFFPFDAEPYMTGLPQLLKDKGFSVFHDGNKAMFIPEKLLQKQPEDGLLIGISDQNIQNINNEYLLINGAWAVDSIAEDKATSVIVKVNNTYYPAFYGIYRPDIAKHFSNKRYQYSGFETGLPMSCLKEGDNYIQFLVIGKNADYYYASSVYTYFNNIDFQVIEGAKKNFSATDYAIDLINGAPPKNEYKIRLTDTFSITGWAVDRTSQKALVGIQIKIGNRLYTVQSMSRPDVADHFNNPNYENSGFFFEIAASGLGEGTHHWSVIGFCNDGYSYYEIPGGEITIQNGS